MPTDNKYITSNKYSTIVVENFGKIEKAEIELAPFTLFIGDNNSGKSYLMTLLWGLIDIKPSNLIFENPEIKESKAYENLYQIFDQYLENRKKPDSFDSEVISLLFIEIFNQYFNTPKNCQGFLESLFNTDTDIFCSTKIKLLLSQSDILKSISLSFKKGSSIDMTFNILELALNKDTSNNEKLKNVLGSLKDNLKQNPEKILEHYAISELGKIEKNIPTIEEFLQESEYSIISIDNYMPIPMPILKDNKRTIEQFIKQIFDIFWKKLKKQSSASPTFLPTARTGFILSYLDLAETSLGDRYSLSVKNKNGLVKFSKPVISYLQQLIRVGRSLKIKDKKEELIISFVQNEIIDGEINISRDNSNKILYRPNGYSKDFPLHITSGVVTELASIVAFLEYGMISTNVFIEEPEISLHPALQKKMAMLLIRLINVTDRRIFITTHSDTITQHINNMIKLSNNPKETQKNLLKEYEYTKDDCINLESVRMYQFEVDSSHRTHIILLPSSENGFELPTFNTTIENINKEYHAFQENVKKGIVKNAMG